MTEFAIMEFAIMEFLRDKPYDTRNYYSMIARVGVGAGV